MSTYDGPYVADYRVWHIPQIPGAAFMVDCTTLAAANKIVDVLADYDLFQFDNRIKPDYANVSGITIWSESEGCYEDIDEADA